MYSCNHYRSFFYCLYPIYIQYTNIHIQFDIIDSSCFWCRTKLHIHLLLYTKKQTMLNPYNMWYRSKNALLVASPSVQVWNSRRRSIVSCQVWKFITVFASCSVWNGLYTSQISLRQRLNPHTHSPAAVVVPTHEHFSSSAADGAVWLIAVIIVLIRTLQERVL